MSVPANFSEIYVSFKAGQNRTQPTGFSSHWSWIGGMPCSPNSNQFGGFGGGGAGCYGGGGGGGFVGGHGGQSEYDNGQGGFSYYNPEAVVLLLDASSELTPKGMSQHGNPHQQRSLQMAKLWKNQGSGFVYIIPSLSDDTCQVKAIFNCKDQTFLTLFFQSTVGNCSELGAVCMALTQDLKLTRCVCPNGIILDHMHPRCSEGKTIFKG